MLTLIPDFEKAVSGVLRTHSAITALGARVVASPPDDGNRDTPWVRVTRLDASPSSTDVADHLISALMQFDCYAGAGDSSEGGGQPEANLLGRTVRAVLGDIASHSVDDVVFTGARITGDARIPDSSPGFEPARERVIITALVWGHAS